MASGLNAEEAKEDFGKRMKQMVADSSTGLGIALGVSTGLLKKMSSCAEPKTSQQIADEMGMKERYVREWLSIMVCGNIIDIDETAQTFFLPHHRRPYFTPGCLEEGYSLTIRCIPMLSTAFDEIGRCLQKDGPIGFSDSLFNYSPATTHYRFRNSLAKELEAIPDLKKKLESGISVIDIGCASGVSTRAMAEHFPNSRFVGLDISDDAIKEAKRELAAATKKPQNVKFVRASAEAMDPDWSNKFDLLFVFCMVHNTYRPDVVLQEFFRVLKPGAKAVIHEPSMFASIAENAKIPGNSFRYAYGLFRCLPTSMEGPDCPGLGPAWGTDRCCEMLKQTGFNVVAVEGEADLATTWMFVCEKPL